MEADNRCSECKSENWTRYLDEDDWELTRCDCPDPKYRITIKEFFEMVDEAGGIMAYNKMVTDAGGMKKYLESKRLK